MLIIRMTMILNSKVKAYNFTCKEENGKYLTIRCNIDKYEINLCC